MILKINFFIAAMALVGMIFVQSPAFCHEPGDKGDDHKQNLLVISPSDHNFLFKSVLDKLISKSGYDYVPIQRPTQRAIKETQQGIINIAGPYPASMFDFEFKDLNIYEVQSGHWLVKWEPMNIYPITLDNSFSFTSLEDIKDLRVGYLFNQFNPPVIKNQNVSRAKNIDQLINLLKANRIDVALLSYRLAMEAKLTNPYVKLHMGKLPLVNEMQYLYINPLDDHFIRHFFYALLKLKRTQFYKVRKEKFGETEEIDRELFLSGPPTSPLR